MNNELNDKYEKFGFIKKINDSDIEEITEVLKNTIVFISTESTLSRQFYMMYIALIRLLYTEFHETDYKKIYFDLRDWYEDEGMDWENSISVDEVDLMMLYVQHYKKKYRQ